MSQNQISDLSANEEHGAACPNCKRLRAGLRSAQLQLSIALQGVPPQLETLEIGFRRAYDMTCATLRDEQSVGPAAGELLTGCIDPDAPHEQTPMGRTVGVMICPDCKGERRWPGGALCKRCKGNGQINLR